MTEINNKVFIDTNILAYALDEDNEHKRKKSIETIELLKAVCRGVVSNQVLAELFLVATRKLKKPLSLAQAAKLVSALAESSTIQKINYDHQTVKKAAVVAAAAKIKIWDALIAQTMLDNGVYAIYTENEKDFKKIPGIKPINPFR